MIRAIMGPNLLILAVMVFNLPVKAVSLCAKYGVVFPNESSLAAVSYLNPPFKDETTQFSLCYRIITQTDRATIFSYAINGVPNEILLEMYKYSIELYIGDAVAELLIRAPKKGILTHYCVLWDSARGLVEIYREGKVINSEEFKNIVGKKVRPKGMAVLGQDQDTFGGGFDASTSMRGTLSDVQIWDRLLTPVEVAAVAVETATKEGNIIAWSKDRSKWETEGGAEIVNLQCA